MRDLHFLQKSTILSTLYLNTRLIKYGITEWEVYTMKQYKTIDIARRMGIHVNTVRLYEKCALIPKPERLPNGYRVFTDLHIEQFKLARAALRVEVLQNGLRKQAVNIIKVSAAGRRTYRHLLHTKRSCGFSRCYHRHAAELGVEWTLYNQAQRERLSCLFGEGYTMFEDYPFSSLRELLTGSYFTDAAGN